MAGERKSFDRWHFYSISFTIQHISLRSIEIRDVTIECKLNAFTPRRTPYFGIRDLRARKNFDLVKLDHHFHPEEHVFWVNACWRLCFLLWKRKSKFKPDITDRCLSTLGRRRIKSTVLQNSSPSTWVKPLLGIGWICFWKVTRQCYSRQNYFLGWGGTAYLFEANK